MPGCYLEMLEDLALTISPRVHSSLLRICVSWTVRFLVPPFILIFFFFFFLKKKKNPFFELSLAEANRELLRGRLLEAVLLRLGCPRQPIKRNLGNKAPLLYWVTFDSLKGQELLYLAGSPADLAK